MKIAILGAGAMGSLFGGYLSRNNEVHLIDVSDKIANAINSNGLVIEEPDGARNTYPVQCLTDSSSLPEMDLVIVFVKAMYSKSALEKNKRLIGSKTLLLSLQNGAGHEDLLSEYASPDNVVFGTTQHNSAVLSPGVIRHGGSGHSYVGRLNGKLDGLNELAANLTSCGLEASASSSVNHMVWQKLFTNVSASALTGVLQETLGFIYEDKNAWEMCSRLIHEAVMVAKADGEDFDESAELEKVRKVCVSSPSGITSICADMRNGRKTEVDTISGSVVKKAHRLGVSVPSHEMVVNLIHAMENRRK